MQVLEQELTDTQIYDKKQREITTNLCVILSSAFSFSNLLAASPHCDIHI